jgi:homoserine kinase
VRLTARVPATSANLGPGFDCFGLALDLCNEVSVDTEAEPGVSWEGEGADELPTDGSDMVSRSIRSVAEREGRTVGSLALHGLNRIPLERGLGSSAAACVAGIALASRLLRLDMSPEAALGLASEIEGHPDNAAAAIHGGFTLAVRDDGMRVQRLTPHPEVRPVVFVPEAVRLPTQEARRALPERVPLEDAVFNLGRSALAVLAFTHDPDLLFAALEDRLHQSVRLALVPEVAEVFETLRRVGLPVCVSGAGPSLLAFERPDVPMPDPGDGWRVFRLPVRSTGVEILEGETLRRAHG